MTDQIVGAVIMWVIGSLVFLVPVILIAVNLPTPEAFPILVCGGADDDVWGGVSGHQCRCCRGS